VLLGFGMNLSSVLQVGGQSLPIIVSTIATSLIVAFALYKALHMDSTLSPPLSARLAEGAPPPG